MSPGSKSQSTIPKPQYNASSIPPTYPWLKDKGLRPRPQHIPGSFGPSVEPHVERNFGLLSPTLGEVPAAPLVELGVGQPHHAHSATAKESLLHAKESDAVSVRSKVSLKGKISQSSMRSTASVRDLMNPRGNQSQLRRLAQPVVTRGNERVSSDNDTFDTVPLSPEPSTQPGMRSSSLRAPGTNGAPQQTQISQLINGTPLSQLLSELPPIKQSTISDLQATEALSDPWRQSIREHSRERSSHDEAASQAFSHRTDLPPKSAQPIDRLVQKRRDSQAASTQSRSNPSTPMSSASRKAASISRAITALSQLSSRSNLRALPLRSSTNYDRLGSTDEIPLTSTTDYGVVSGPRSSWVHNVIKRSSTIPIDPLSNLTARPSQNRKATVERQQVIKPARNGSNDENVHHDSLTTNATDEQALQRQQQKDVDDFSRTIFDLETLLREALSIAHRAADKDDDRPATNQRYSSPSSTAASEPESSRSASPDEANHGKSKPLNRANHGIIIREPENGGWYQGRSKKARGVTPYPAGSRTASIVPPSDDKKALSTQQGGDANLSMEQSRKGSAKNAQPQTITIRDDLLQPFESRDWAVPKRQATTQLLEPNRIPQLPRRPTNLQAPLKEVRSFHVRPPKPLSNALSEEAVHQHINAHQKPPIQPRQSSARLRYTPRQQESINAIEMERIGSSSGDSEGYGYADFEEPHTQYRTDTQMSIAGSSAQEKRGNAPDPLPGREDSLSPLPLFGVELQDPGVRRQSSVRKGRRSHFSIKEPQGFSLSRSHKRAPIARDWSTSRKRWTAAIACASTALIGMIIGIYAGEVPAIQYMIVDEHHYTILGNVVLFIGLAITTVMFFPLPLLHGRKPYTLAALAILLPLQFPQALVVDTQRSPSAAIYRVGLLLPRAAAGLVMGFANINFLATLLDLFGSSLQSSNPHQELVDINDVRRHGGGMGMWLGIWTWCFIGSIGVGFLIGAVIVSGLDVAWGFWITILLTAFVLLLNVLAPETRRSAYRRSLAEVYNGGEVSRRVARGEMKMHIDATGPIYWWEEVVAGWRLCLRMLKQPGFIVLSLYLGWIYGQVVLVIVLLGALTSKYYRFHPQYVGLAVAAIPLGALLATPFQKASLFSRARTQKPRTDSMTVQKHVTRSSHFVRRAIFMIMLPFAGLAYTLASGGRHTNFMVPIVFAGLIGFLSNLAIAECNGIIMETYDTSDLQPGMTGRPRKALPEEIRRKRTNFSCFPRVTAAFAISQAFAFLIAAAGTGTGGVIERRLGAQTATAVVAGILLGLTLLLIAVLTRFKTVQIIPTQRYGTNILSGPEDEWKPVIIGHPSGNTRRMSLLELGKMTRWSEIRRRNRLATGLSG